MKQPQGLLHTAHGSSGVLHGITGRISLTALPLTARWPRGQELLASIGRYSKQHAALMHQLEQIKGVKPMSPWPDMLVIRDRPYHVERSFCAKAHVWPDLMNTDKICGKDLAKVGFWAMPLTRQGCALLTL